MQDLLYILYPDTSSCFSKNFNFKAFFDFSKKQTLVYQYKTRTGAIFINAFRFFNSYFFFSIANELNRYLIQNQCLPIFFKKI